MNFANPALLFGLIALVIPPIIHFLNRRQPVAIDWAAMHFLRMSSKTRRRIVHEHLPLMCFRCGLLAALVLALALPVLDLGCLKRVPGGIWLARMSGREHTDVVLLIDGSLSSFVDDPSATYPE